MAEVNSLVSELSRADIFTPLSYLFSFSGFAALSPPPLLINPPPPPTDEHHGTTAQIKIWTLGKWVFEHLCRKDPVNNEARSLASASY